jgi:tRNA U34 5-methylaminomethyl-2-thiouridine-forming methyltransferase MnmC
MPGDYQLVPLANGQQTLFSAHYGEKMHPGLGPAAEAEWLYVRQLQIRERMARAGEEFVVWDVGLGAAANAVALLRAAEETGGALRIVSFDNTPEPLEFALAHAGALAYLAGLETELGALLRERRVTFARGGLTVRWEFVCGDFPARLAAGGVPGGAAAPHAIFYDAFSPAKNPAMWTQKVFDDLHRALDPARPCALTTYSRSTLIRATLLVAGFYVGVGHATGRKEETTIAANAPGLVAEPLNARWLERARRSDSAEPLPGPDYVRAKLTAATAEKLARHPQFQPGALR